MGASSGKLTSDERPAYIDSLIKESNVKVRSILSVVAGVVFIIVVTTLVDVLLHLGGIYPVNQPMSDSQAAIATGYRLIIGIAGAWLTARLAPQHPMKHALILGVVGTVLGLIGLAVTWGKGMGPAWYPIALVVLAIPQCWAGGRLHETMAARRAEGGASA